MSNHEENIRDVLMEFACTLKELVSMKKMVIDANMNMSILFGIDQRIDWIHSKMSKMTAEVNKMQTNASKMLQKQHEYLKTLYDKKSNKEVLEEIENEVFFLSIEVATDPKIESIRKLAKYFEFWSNTCKTCDKETSLRCLRTDSEDNSMIMSNDYLCPISSTETTMFCIDEGKLKKHTFINEFTISKHSDFLPFIRKFSEGLIVCNNRDKDTLHVTEAVELENSSKSEDEQIITNEDYQEDDEYVDQSKSTPKFCFTLNREIMVNKLGSILRDVIKKPKTFNSEHGAFIKEYFDIQEKGALIKEIKTDTTILREYNFERKDSKCIMSTTEPNIRTIFSDIYAGDIGNIQVISSHFILMREVEVTCEEENTKQKFIEPVYVVMKPKGSKSTVIKNEIGDENSSYAASFKDKTNPQHIVICALIRRKPDEIGHLKTFTTNILRVHEMILKIQNYMVFNMNCYSVETFSTNEPILPLIDRGVSIMLSYKKTENMGSKNTLEITEYYSKISIANKVCSLIPRNAGETKMVRFETHPKDKNSRDIKHAFTIKKLVNLNEIEQKWTLKNPRNFQRLVEVISQPNLQTILEDTFKTFGKQADALLKLQKSLGLFTISNVIISSDSSKATCAQFRMRINIKLENEIPKDYNSLKNIDSRLKSSKGFYSLENHDKDACKIKLLSNVNIESCLTDQEIGSKKMILKFVVIDSSWNQVSDMEINKNLSLKVSHKKTISCEEYDKSFEDDMRSTLTRVTETPAKRIIEQILVMKSCPDKALIVRAIEPNPKSILCRRLNIGYKKYPNQREPAGKLSDIFTGLEECIEIDLDENESLNEDGKHSENSCPLASCGMFLIKSFVTILEKEHKLDENGMSQYTDKNIQNHEVIKIVQCFCEKCNKTPVIMQGTDRVSDAVSFTLNNQILSPLDVHIALAIYIKQVNCALWENDLKIILNRFKCRIQRFMNFGFEYESEKDVKKSIETNTGPSFNSKTVTQLDHMKSNNLRDCVCELTEHIQKILAVQLGEQMLDQSLRIKEKSNGLINKIKDAILELAKEVNNAKSSGSEDMNSMINNAKLNMKADFPIIANEFDINKCLSEWKMESERDEDKQDFAPSSYKILLPSEFFQVYKVTCKECTKVNRLSCGFAHLSKYKLILQGDGLKPISTLDYVTIYCKNSKQVPLISPKLEYSVIYSLNNFFAFGRMGPNPILSHYGLICLFQLSCSIKLENMNSLEEEFQPQTVKMNHSSREMDTTNLSETQKDDLDKVFLYPHSEYFLTREVTITECGRIKKIEEKELTNKNKNEDEQLKFCKNALKTSKLFKKQKSVSLIHKDYKEITETHKTTVEVDEPNIQSIIREVIKADRGKIELLLSHFIILREVHACKYSKDSDAEQVSFIEPIYVYLEALQQFTTNSLKDSESSNKNNRAHYRLFYCDGDVENKFISSFSVRNDDESIKEKIVDVVRNMYCNAAFENKLLLDSDFLPMIWDRGIVMKITYDPKTENLEHFTEYETNNSLQSKLKYYKAYDESSKIRATSNEILCEAKKHKFKSLIKHDGYHSTQVIEYYDEALQKTFKETIYQPSFKAILNYFLLKPAAKNFSGSDLLIEERNISFFIDRNYFLSQTETSTEAIITSKTAAEKILVKLKIERTESKIDVSEIKNNFKEKILKKAKGIYRLVHKDLEENDFSIIYNDTADLKNELKVSYQGFNSGQGKDILKLMLFNDSAQVIADLEIKSQLVNKKITKICMSSKKNDRTKKSEYNDNDLSYIIISNQITETSNCRITQKCALIQEVNYDHSFDKAILVQVFEPNPHAIIWKNMKSLETQDKRFLEYFEWEPNSYHIGDFKKGLTKNLKSVSVASSNGNHEKMCPYQMYGCYGAYIIIVVKLIGIDLLTRQIKEFETISYREEFKLVKCLCLQCEKAISILDNADLLSDTGAFTLPNQVLSPIDIGEAIDSLIAETIREQPNEEISQHIAKRFKHRIQRCMMHGIKIMPEKCEDDKE